MPLGGGGAAAEAYALKMPPTGPATDEQPGIAHMREQGGVHCFWDPAAAHAQGTL